MPSWHGHILGYDRSHAYTSCVIHFGPAVRPAAERRCPERTTAGTKESAGPEDPPLGTYPHHEILWGRPPSGRLRVLPAPWARRRPTRRRLPRLAPSRPRSLPPASRWPRKSYIPPAS